MYGYLLFLIVYYFNWIFINNKDLLVCFSKNLGLLLTYVFTQMEDTCLKIFNLL